MITKLHYLDGRIEIREDIAENLETFKMVDPSGALKGKINAYDYLDEGGLKKTLLHIRVFEYFELYNPYEMYSRNFVEVDPLNKKSWEYNEMTGEIFVIEKDK